MSAPRRSSRLAEKPKPDYTEVKLIEPEPKRIRVSKPHPEPQPYIPPVESAINFRDNYHRILNEAQRIHHDLGQARTREDFDAIAERCDKLWHQDHEQDISGGMTPMFLTDCMRDCREAILGHFLHSYAISSIKWYIRSILNTRKWYEKYHPAVFTK